jgi:hypothetical protein
MICVFLPFLEVGGWRRRRRMLMTMALISSDVELNYHQRVSAEFLSQAPGSILS